MERVPNDPLRERFQALHDRDGLSLHELAKRVGWIRQYDRRPDSMRVARTLGLAPTRSRGRDQVRRQISYSTAVRFAEALDLDPYEAGV